MKTLWDLAAKGVCFTMGHDWDYVQWDGVWECTVCGERREKKP